MSTEHLTLSEDELPLPPTAEGILSVLRNVLNKPYVQSIHLSQGNPIQVTWYRDLSDSLDSEDPDESPESVLSRVELDELAGESNPKELLIDGMLKVSLSGEFPTHLLVGDISTFRDCMSIPNMVSLSQYAGTNYLNFMGLPLIEVGGLQKDSMVLLSAGVKSASLSETKSGLKLSI